MRSLLPIIVFSIIVVRSHPFQPQQLQQRQQRRRHPPVPSRHRERASSSSSSIVRIVGGFGDIPECRRPPHLAHPSVRRSSPPRRSIPVRHDDASIATTSLFASSTKSDDDGAIVPHPGTGGTASVPNEIFNLVKSIVGAGVLSLPAGIAAFGDAPTAAIPAILIIALIGAFSAYGFSLIGRVCSYTGARTYRDAWSRSVGDGSSWLPAVTVTFKTCFAILSYSMILADTGRSLLSSAGYSASRNAALFGITITTLLPLCLIRDLGGLAPFSLVGVAGMFYTALAMAARYLRGSYAIGGGYAADVASSLRPRFGDVGAMGAFGPNVFILVCMLSTAYMAHFNAPKFYVELRNNTMRRYNAVVASSFGISVLLFASIGSLGFLTFGGACSGLILNNYSGTDALMGLSRIAVLISIVFSFPLVFAGARDGWLDLLRIPVDDRTNAVLTRTTLAVLSGVTLIASRLRELAFIMSFAGATMGNALIYVYPALMFRSAVRDMGDKASKGLRREVPFAMFTALLGVAMGGMGAKMALGLL
ncbi:hypothetical protein ACHAXA_001779 [Cyclostephanos tholiformis]|uniref:Amino acid transporter transmembrane domain-containing protein n=1 Tax=Cyclostephanos tholiformis TaxID=382380 RepID=A0ABD3RXQ5_9STRA